MSILDVCIAGTPAVNGRCGDPACVCMTAYTKRVAELNDQARRAMGVLCRATQTHGIRAMSPADQSTIRERVETFNDFNKENDPYGEHDFGSFTHAGKKIFWKMDYYDAAMEYGSEDPSDPSQTTRLLTIMLASEY